jgi:glycine C-acetyltransferase
MNTSSNDSFYADVTRQLSDLKNAGLLKEEQPIVTPQDGRVQTMSNGRPRWLVNMCSNNYLGLSNHPRIISSAISGLEFGGFGMSSVRFICGTHHLHKELEERISDFLKLQDTILFPSCFDANSGFFEVFLSEDDQIISDRLNHASIIDGIRLCKARRSVYENCDLGQLEHRLREASGARRRVIVTDGVFSMDGVIAPLNGICELADRYGALVYVDDSHGIGAIGRTGGGAVEHCGVAGRVDFIAGTLGKALGGASGGFISGKSEAVELLRQKARPYLFSNSIAPALAAAAITAFDILEEEPDRLIRLKENAALVRGSLENAGFTLLGAGHAIVPIAIGDSVLNARLSAEVNTRGVYAVAFSHPVVPHGAARIRIQVSAAHTATHLDLALAAFCEAATELGILA